MFVRKQPGHRIAKAYIRSMAYSMSLLPSYSTFKLEDTDTDTMKIILFLTLVAIALQQSAADTKR